MSQILSLSDFMKSTFKISVSGRGGSALMCRYDSEYVVMFTCWHLFCDPYPHVGRPFSENSKDREVYFKIHNSDGDIEERGQCMRPTDDSDMCAVIFNDCTLPVLIDYCDTLHTDQFSVGDEVFMFGFPFITDMKNCLFSGNSFDPSYMAALLKHGYIMGTVRDKNRDVILFDMPSHVGFSGSPIVVKRANPDDKNEYAVLSVMSGHYKDISEENYKVLKDECDKAGIHFSYMVANSSMSYGCRFSNIVPYLPELFRRKEYTKS